MGAYGSPQLGPYAENNIIKIRRANPFILIIYIFSLLALAKTVIKEVCALRFDEKTGMIIWAAVFICILVFSIANWSEMRIKFKNKTLIIRIILALCIMLCISGLNSSTPKENSITRNNTAFENYEAREKNVISPEEYKSMCSTLSYSDIARDPQKYKGTYATFSGKVQQVEEDGEHIILLVALTRGEWDIWSNVIYVNYTRKDKNESRILEDDIITMYGKMNGIKSYTTVLGAQAQVPHLFAEYIVINK